MQEAPATPEPIWDLREEVRGVPCPTCGAERGEHCRLRRARRGSMVRQQNHIARHRVWRRQRDPLALTPDDYGPYLTSEAWYERAEAAKARARFRCQLCSSPSRLVAHHRTYVRLGRELPEDLTCLCRSCHESFHEQHELYEQGMRP